MTTAIEPHGSRLCSHPSCTTRLSRYNPDDVCGEHGGWSDESVPRRGRKRSPGAPGRMIDLRDRAEMTDPGEPAHGEGPARLEPIHLDTADRARADATRVVAVISLTVGGSAAAARGVWEELAADANLGVTMACGPLSTVAAGPLVAVLALVEAAHHLGTRLHPDVTTNVQFRPREHERRAAQPA